MHSGKTADHIAKIDKPLISLCYWFARLLSDPKLSKAIANYM